ncbi:hypothetical protein HYY69_00645 [Candidatus Woesearchaeota archaeon]|nr:hypothetical protein [Candidatus Woesearchaeota archaeon]
MYEMKRIYVVLVVLLYMIGVVPLVAAESGTGDENTGSDTSSGEVSGNVEAEASAEAEIGYDNNGKDTYGEKQREKIKEMKERRKEYEEKLKDNFKEAKADWFMKKGFEELSDEQKRKLKYAVQQHKADFLGKMNEHQAEVLAHMDRADLQVFMQACKDNEDACRERLDKMKLKKAQVKERLAIQDLKKVRLRYLQAEKKFERAEQHAEEARKKFLELKEKGASDEEILEQAKEFVIQSSERLQAHLEKILEKVEENNYDDKAVDELEAAVERLDKIIEQARLATTKEEIRAQAQELKHIYKLFKHRIKVHAQRSLQGAAQGLFQSSEKAVAALECAEEKLETSVDTANLMQVIKQIVEKQASAKEHYEQAQKFFDKARSSEDGEQAQRSIDAAKKELSKAFEAMHDVPKFMQQGIKFVNSNQPGLLGECRGSLQDKEEYEITESEEEVEEAVVDISAKVTGEAETNVAVTVQ